jgi:hypothetical protein
MRKLTNKEKYWLAGFIDGEGTISIRQYCPKIITKPHKYKIYSHIRVCIEVGNTDKNVIKYISNLLNVNIRIIKRGKHYKDFYSVTISAQKAKPVLKLLHNLLKIKKEQANLCLKLLKTFKLNKRTKKGRFRKLNKRTTIKRWALYEQCRILNYRGKLTNKNKFIKELRKRLGKITK